MDLIFPWLSKLVETTCHVIFQFRHNVIMRQSVIMKSVAQKKRKINISHADV